MSRETLVQRLDAGRVALDQILDVQRLVAPRRGEAVSRCSRVGVMFAVFQSRVTRS